MLYVNYNFILMDIKKLQNYFLKCTRNHHIIKKHVFGKQMMLRLSIYSPFSIFFCVSPINFTSTSEMFSQDMNISEFFHSCIKYWKSYVRKSQLIKYFTQPCEDLALCINGCSLFQLSRLIMCTHKVLGIPRVSEKSGSLCDWMSIHV